MTGGIPAVPAGFQPKVKVTSISHLLPKHFFLSHWSLILYQGILYDQNTVHDVSVME